MAFLTQVGTTTTPNTNLTTATLVHTQTNTTRIRKLYVNVFADQVKGNGDYVAYITKQRAGAGSFYESVKTTKAAAVGITSIEFESIPITLNATDVMKVYLLGLATDNDGTADVIVDVNEEWADIDANGRVDVGEWLGVAPDALSSGKVAADIKLWLAAAPAAVTASGYIQAALVRWLTDNAAGTPLALSTNKVQSVDSTVPTANAVADQVWDETMALHVGAGSTGATLNALAPGAPINLTVDSTEVTVE